MFLSTSFGAGGDWLGNDISPRLGTCGSTADFSNASMPVGLLWHRWCGKSHSHLSSVAIALWDMLVTAYLHRSQILLLGALVLLQYQSLVRA